MEETKLKRLTLTLAETKLFAGRSFVTKSHNAVRMSVIESSAFEAHWKTQPTENDMNDLERWMKDILGLPLAHTRSTGNQNQCKDLENWKQRNRG